MTEMVSVPADDLRTGVECLHETGVRGDWLNRLRAALPPEQCEWKLSCRTGTANSHRCIHPQGHHSYYFNPYANVKLCCDKSRDDPIHAAPACPEGFGVDPKLVVKR